ncbi:hypothetical protein E2562_019725 [Oryza meyeriana var. granulata]|uniref:Protein kinase domain-containing protein n=1 Tax=Oryza meyeriana var. granulata TaxID=110450 RepID=A0A6G1C9G3_9ORYZ|nr:hypothetical protein E2562_019725 [Oryza meyeriana var. granulata]
MECGCVPIVGTYGYAAPEYVATASVKPARDVNSLAVVMRAGGGIDGEEGSLQLDIIWTVELEVEVAIRCCYCLLPCQANNPSFARLHCRNLLPNQELPGRDDPSTT